MLMNRRNLTEDGFASLVIAIVLVLVLSLITVGFAELMRREQRSALDKHLSQQAYYAAEAGVNDAAKAINAGYTGQKKTCAKFDATHTEPGASYLQQNQVGAASDGISYTCLLIDPDPPTLDYGDVGQVQSITTEISGVDNADPTVPKPIKSLFFSWQSSGTSRPFVTGQDSAHTLFRSNSWPYTGILRISLTPLTSGCVQRSCLADNTFTAFLYPNDSSSASGSNPLAPGYASASFASSIGTDQGVFVNGNCNSASKPLTCNVEITNLGQVNYLMTIRSVYDDNRVHISGLAYDSTFVRFKNSQTLVDSTGKAQDILRRIQVRIPSRNEYPHSDYGIEAMGGICKQLELYPDTSSKNNCTP